jgi:hypothetical protein
MNRPLKTKALDVAAAGLPGARRSPFWAAILLLLVAVITFESQFDWGRLVRPETIAPGGSAAADFALQAGGRIDRRSDYSDYLQAPVFLASREPIFLPDPTRGSVSTARSRDLGLELLGTILSRDDPVALMKTIPGGEVVLLQLGEELGGWTLIEVEGRLVRLQRDGETFELYLDPERGAARTGLRRTGDTSLDMKGGGEPPAIANNIKGEVAQ